MRKPGTRREDAVELAAAYSRGHRAYEIGGILTAAVGAGWLCFRLVKAPPLSGWWMPLAALLGILFADFISGFVHWGFDTWGKLDTPVLGKLAIRTFREHHVDQKAITRHDFIETNGHNIALSAVCTFGGVNALSGETTLSSTFTGMSLLCAAFFVSMTSQIHKWAHMDTPPSVIRFLQRARLILAPEHHSLHHSAPYDRNYCITVGWMNAPLRSVRFFETLERVITLVTGAVAREDDIGKEAAIVVAALKEAEATEVEEPASEPAVVKIDTR